MTDTSQVTPYWRLSGFYFFYFASLGVLVPFWPLYLQSLEFNPQAIAGLMAILMATKIVAPNVWGFIADRTGRRMAIVRTGTLAAVAAFAGVFFGSGFWWLAAVMILFSFFWNAALPQFEATTFNYLGSSVHRYSSIRLWGSIGFILAVVGIGAVLEYQSTALVPPVVLALFIGIWIMSLVVPERTTGHLPIDHEPLHRVLKRPAVAALLAVVFLMQASHGPYYTFYSIYLEAHGYGRALIGQLWALGVLAEVIVFLFMYRLIPRFGLRTMMLASLLLASLRWLLTGWFVDSLAIMAVAQLLHAASFGVYHAAAIQLIHRYFTGRHQGRGQALYSSVSFGAGGAAGSLASGFAWEGLGAEYTYSLAAIVSMTAFVIAWRYGNSD